MADIKLALKVLSLVSVIVALASAAADRRRCGAYKCVPVRHDGNDTCAQYRDSEGQRQQISFTTRGCLLWAMCINPKIRYCHHGPCDELNPMPCTLPQVPFVDMLRRGGSSTTKPTLAASIEQPIGNYLGDGSNQRPADTNDL